MDVLGWALHNQRLRWQHLHPAVHAGIPRSFDGNLYVPAGVAMILGALATLLPPSSQPTSGPSSRHLVNSSPLSATVFPAFYIDWFLILRWACIVSAFAPARHTPRCSWTRPVEGTCIAPGVHGWVGISFAMIFTA